MAVRRDAAELWVIVEGLLVIRGSMWVYHVSLIVTQGSVECIKKKT